MSLRHEETVLEEAEVQEVLRLRGEEEFGQVELPETTPPVRRARSPWLAAALAATVLTGAVFALSGPVFSAAKDVISQAKTLPIGSRPYGPDVFPGARLDPSFRPSGPLPVGLSLSAIIGQTVYGCGDHKGDVVALPPEGARAKLVEERLVEFLEFLRDRKEADAHLPVIALNDPRFETKFPHKLVGLNLEWRNGGATCTVEVPLGKGADEVADLKRIAHNAAKQMNDGVADGIDFINRRID